MKMFYFLFVPIMLMFFHHENSLPLNSSINPIIGEAGFLQKYGEYPDESTSDHLRISTHLAYVLETLREKNVFHLSENQKQSRFQLLNHLEKYIERGEFPHNNKYRDQRKPCFIDEENRICAVGYLVEQSAGREVASQINDEFQYATIMEMDSKRLDEWIAESGLSKLEFAMIQPTYLRRLESEARNGLITSGIASGINLGLGTLQVIQRKNGNRKKWVPIVGMFTSALQTTIGISSYPRDLEFILNINDPSVIPFYSPDQIRPVYNKEKMASIINIGVGSAMFMLSAANLIFPIKKKKKNYSYQFYSYPTGDNNMELGLQFCKRF